MQKPMQQYAYLKRIKIQLMVVTALMACLIPIAIYDGRKYGIAAGVALIVAYFCFLIWQDSNNKILVYSTGLVQEKGAGPFKKIREIKWNDITFLKDNTGLFTLGRSFYVQNNLEKPERICFDSTLKDYRELLQTIVKMSPNVEVDKRAYEMMSKIGIEVRKK